MADASKFLHTWSLSKDSWLLKFYRFWYPMAHRDQITFCKLFWAVVCAPLMGLAWIGIGIGVGIIAPFIWVYEKYENRKLAKMDAEPEPKVEKGPSKAKKAAGTIPAFFSRLADAISAWFQKHAKFGAILGWTFLIVAGLVVTGAVVWLLVLLVIGLHHLWSGVDFIDSLIALGCLLAAIVVGAAIAWGIAATKPGEAFCNAIWSFLCAIGRFFRGIGHFFATGYYAVKYRTCPKVTVSD